MFQRSLGLLAVAAALLVCGGCVAKSDYLQKQAETDSLSRNLAALNTENRDLQDKISNLQKNIREFQENIKGLREEISGLHAAKEKLIAEWNGLNTSLETLREESNRTIEELRNRNTELEGDKQMLEESIALLKKSKEELMTRNNLMDAEKQNLEESIALLKKSKEELMTRNTELESDMQMIEESIALLKDSNEAEVNTVSRTYEEFLAEMKDEIDQGKIAVTELQGKLTMDLFDKVLFYSGGTEVKPEGLAILKRVVKILITVTDKAIRIEGHTDNIPITGALAKRYHTNRELSAARALNVTRYLEKRGIDPSILSTAAFGEYQPVADNDTPEGRAKNRRIAIVLLPMK